MASTGPHARDRLTTRKMFRLQLLKTLASLPFMCYERMVHFYSKRDKYELIARVVSTSKEPQNHFLDV